MKILSVLLLAQILIFNQIQEAKTQLPLYYAWFINSCDSNELNDISQNYLKEIINIPEFKENYKKYNITNYEELKGYYAKCNKILHCTAYFCGHGSVPDCELYHNNEKVNDAIRCPYTLKIIGMVITPQTLGYRIHLNDNQKEIYNQNDDEVPAKLKRSIGSRALYSNLSCGENGDPKEWNENSSNESCVKTVHKALDMNQDIDYQPTSGKGSRAHLTICTALGISAVTTGFDLISVVKEEQLNPDYCKTESIDITNGTICRINKTNDTWVFKMLVLHPEAAILDIIKIFSTEFKLDEHGETNILKPSEMITHWGNLFSRIQ